MVDIEKVDLLNKSLDMKNSGYRLAQICAIKLQKFMLLYSFIKDSRLVTLRFNVDQDEPVESLSWLYSYAFLYENEIKDLFGVKVRNMRLDYQGHFYELAHKTPYNPEGNPAQADSINSKENEVKNNG